MFLQVWQRQDDHCVVSEIQGELIFIPLGKMLVLPASTIHGGGFRTSPLKKDDEDESVDHDSTGSNSYSALFQDRDEHYDEREHATMDNPNGNLRFHVYMARGATRRLPTHQTNTYTEPTDKRRELCERYVNAPHMKTLLKYFFV